eukprot:GEMP01072501.1.p1 GENE.GEMP01072501.1~~GEMP01072501.1.p1  ORF type:complete len:142 (+),score=32.61 GEMP01072501.1:24-449(+)
MDPPPPGCRAQQDTLPPGWPTQQANYSDSSWTLFGKRDERDEFAFREVDCDPENVAEPEEFSKPQDIHPLERKLAQLRKPRGEIRADDFRVQEPSRRDFDVEYQGDDDEGDVLLQYEDGFLVHEGPTRLVHVVIVRLRKLW